MTSHSRKLTGILSMPGCLMISAAVLPLSKLLFKDASTSWPDDLAFLGFFGGAAFLTSSSFYRGQQLCSSSPGEHFNQRETWFRVMIALTTAILCAGLIACLIQAAMGTIVWGKLPLHHVVEPILLLIIIVCSAGFWTLLARSRMGGMILTGAALALLYLLQSIPSSKKR